MAPQGQAENDGSRPELPQAVIAQAEAVASSNAEEEGLPHHKKRPGHSSTQGSSTKTASDDAAYDLLRVHVGES